LDAGISQWRSGDGDLRLPDILAFSQGDLAMLFQRRNILVRSVAKGRGKILKLGATLFQNACPNADYRTDATKAPGSAQGVEW